MTFIAPFIIPLGFVVFGILSYLRDTNLLFFWLVALIGFLLLIAFIMMHFNIKFRREWRWARSQMVGSADDNPGCILGVIRHLFIWFYMITPSKWISGTWEKQERIRLGDKTPYKNIDRYVIACVTAEVILAVWIGVFQPFIPENKITGWLMFGLYGLLGFRLFDIFQSWVNQFILRGDWNAISVNRSVVLAFIGYGEIVIIGAIFRFENEGSKALYNSVFAMIANPNYDGGPSIIQYVQIVFAVLFAAVVVQHLLGRLSK